MFYQSATVAEAAPVVPTWRAEITVGDIIRWPLDGGSNALGLVVEVERIGGWPVLILAPGAADFSQPVHPGTLRLTGLHEVRRSGLSAPTRFELARRVGIAAGHPALQTEASPVIGHLCESALERLHAERARIHAVRDIAAARRNERCAGRRGDPRTGWRRGTRPVSATQEVR